MKIVLHLCKKNR